MYELDCVKHSVLGGKDADLPGDLAFLTEKGYTDALTFLNDVWKFPNPCFFVWCPSNLLDRIKAIDHLYFPMKILIEADVGGDPHFLIKVGSDIFYSLDLLRTRVQFNGETGFLIKHVRKTIEIW